MGLTRAKDRVYLLHAFRRTFFGEASVGAPSRFLTEIPETLVEGGGAGQRRQGVGPRPRPLERVAHPGQLAGQVPGLARDPHIVLEAVVPRLQLVVGQGPVPDRRPLGQPVDPVALDVVAAVAEFMKVGA